MIPMSELRAASFFVGLKGADIECVTPDGDVPWTIGLEPGVHNAERFLAYMHVGDVLRIEGTASLLSRSGRVRAQSFGEQEFASGANPLFRPSVYTEAEVRMRKLIENANNVSERLAKREASIRSLERQAARTEPVIEEPETEAEPEPAPEAAPEGAAEPAVKAGAGTKAAE